MMKLLILKNNLNPIQNIIAYLYLIGTGGVQRVLSSGRTQGGKPPTNTTLIL